MLQILFPHWFFCVRRPGGATAASNQAYAQYFLFGSNAVMDAWLGFTPIVDLLLKNSTKLFISSPTTVQTLFPSRFALNQNGDFPTSVHRPRFQKKYFNGLFYCSIGTFFISLPPSWRISSWDKLYPQDPQSYACWEVSKSNLK